MKARFDAGTDVALLGVWDAQHGARPLSAAELGRLDETLDGESRAGRVFLVRTHADGGGPVDAYVDEPIPAAVVERLTRLEGEYLLVLPSGALVIDGAERYRSRTPDPGRLDHAVTVPPGEYRVRCYYNEDDEAEPTSERDLIEAVGWEDVEYYDRMNRAGCLGGVLTLLLFPVLWFAVGWAVALPITIATFVAYFHVRERVLRRSARYTRLGEVVTGFRLGRQDPVFVFELQRLDDRGGLTGGSVSLGDA